MDDRKQGDSPELPTDELNEFERTTGQLTLMIENRDSSFFVRMPYIELIEEALHKTLAIEEVEEAVEISLSFVNAEEIQRLNRDFRGVDAVTDVLSFPLDEEEGELYAEEDVAVPLGDIVICIDRVREQAETFKHSERREIAYLAVHSLLHLLGYDHMEEEERLEMRTMEKRVMRALGIFKTDDEADWEDKLQKDWKRKPYFEPTSNHRLTEEEERFDPEREFPGKNSGILQSIGHAIDGVLVTAVTERNMRFDLLAAVLVLLLTLLFNFTRLEFALLSIAIILVLSAEAFNTAVENVFDLVSEGKYNKKIKIAKDAAAGATLLAAINAVIIGYLLFFNKVSHIVTTTYAKIRNIPAHMVAITFALVLISVVILKAVIYRGHGTPLRGGSVSGHTALAFGIATMIFFLSESPTIGALSAILALLVAESRYEGKIHTPGEILLGAICGIAVASGIFSAFL